MILFQIFGVRRFITAFVSGGAAFFVVSLSIQARAEDAVFRAGAATSNITPPLGGEIVGGFLPI
ncbi:MAG TPA: hypothetical protein VFI31_13830, partial [Pirellulales bacterium]|nr:hypothetical protein [Pirellulales bacterium]